MTLINYCPHAWLPVHLHKEEECDETLKLTLELNALLIQSHLSVCFGSKSLNSVKRFL